MPPVRWISEAAKVTHSFSRTYTGNHYIYIVLLQKVPDSIDGNALYVGETSLKPEKRFENHKAGYKASKWVKKYGVQLLPNLYDHLIPLHRTGAKILECKIAEALKENNIPVYGGH